MVNLSISERAARYLATIPPAVSGSGGHAATFRAAHAVTNGFALDEAVAVALLLAHYNPHCLPPWIEADLRHKVRDALANPGAKGRGYLLNQGEALPAAIPATPHKPKWPERDLERIAAIVKEGLTTWELTLLSPGPLDGEDAGHNAAPIVQALFADADAPDPFLCIGQSSRKFATRRLSAWLASGRLAEFSVIVPARMLRRKGRTKAGKPSEHSQDNTGPRRFVVVEFDTGTDHEHAARLWHLAAFAPLALVVHSGNKSLHGWFYCHEQPDDALQRFMRYAASLGADTALFSNRSQFVRMPAGTREGGCRQSVFYYAPDVLTNGLENIKGGDSNE